MICSRDGWGATFSAVLRIMRTSDQAATEKAGPFMQNAHPSISVLVPIYNVQRYLPQCLEALCGQALRDLEIVAINDGSTDGSLAILQEWAAKDDRIVIVDKPNSGYGASMNRGIETARGTYVGIVEPDDYPDRSMFKRLLRMAQRHDCDLVKCNFYEHYDDHEDRIRNFAAFPYNTLFDPVDKPGIICTIPAIWTGLYRKALLDDACIRFRETPGASFQDTSFVMKAWFAASRCALVRKPLLHYRMDNPGSSVKTTDKVFVVCDELEECERFLRARPERCRALLPWFYVDKWSKYRWNYERIDASAHEAFAARIVDEYRAAREAGELDVSLFDPDSRAALEALLANGAARFAADHPETY